MSRKKRHASGKMINNFFGLEFGVQERIPFASHRIAFSITPSIHFCAASASSITLSRNAIRFLPCTPHPHEHWFLCWSLLRARLSKQRSRDLVHRLIIAMKGTWSVKAMQESRLIEDRSASVLIPQKNEHRHRRRTNGRPPVVTEVRDGCPPVAFRCFPNNWQTDIVFLRRVDITWSFRPR